MNMVNIFTEAVLPVLLVFLAGYILQKTYIVDIKAVSTVSIYIMLPCLVFRTFYESAIDQSYMYMIIFSMLLLFALMVINKLYVRLKKYSPEDESGFMLSTAFMNSGNYGAPLMLFAYGEQGLAYSIIFMVLQAIIMNVFGVYYAARGNAGVKAAIHSVLKMPATYAVLVAFLLKPFEVGIPENVFSTIDLVADATIPTMMIILGMQLAQLPIQEFDWGKITYGVIVRMFISPLLAVGIVWFIPMDPLLQKVLIVSAAMPSAATTVMYAIQFDAQPRLVSSITLVTTLVSIVTLTILLSIL